MSILIFAIILILLIFAHELGHFIVAKRSGVKVEEFGFGFPPRIYGKKVGETIYSINWIPFGGFVKILGENPAEEKDQISEDDKNRSLNNKPKIIQAAVLFAGVFFNIVFAWILIVGGFMYGLPTSESYGSEVKDVVLTITGVLPESPASKARVKPGDHLISVVSGSKKLTDIKSATEVQNFISANSESELNFYLVRGGIEQVVSVRPENGIVQDKKAIGISMDMVGTLKLSLPNAITEGTKTTALLTKNIIVAFGTLLKSAFTGGGAFSQITGPVGIVGMVGDASKLGFIYILQFTAFISINLAIVNLIPFPALDGGRILFLIIEAIKRSPIKPKVANILNSVGFILLIVLMLAVTVHDVFKIL